MTAYHIEKCQQPSAILLTLCEDWNLREHLPEFLDQWKQRLEEAGEPITCIVDTRVPSLPGLDDIIWGANQGARGANAVVQHAFVREIIVISTNPVLALAAKGLRAEAFGSAKVRVFSTVEEAMAQVQV